MRNYYDGGPKPLIQPPKRWKGGWWEQPPQAVSAARKKRNIERKSPRRRRMVAFVVTIALLIAGVGGAIALRQIWPSNTPTMGDHWQGDADHGGDHHSAHRARGFLPDGIGRAVWQAADFDGNLPKKYRIHCQYYSHRKLGR